MKRPSIRMSSSSSDEDLGSSLKRVRISTSPGELRLERDFEQLGWTLTNKWLTPGIYMDRVHALQLVIELESRCKLYVDIPRLYPHAPPKIVHVEGGGSFHEHTDYPWTPVMVLSDFLTNVWATWKKQQQQQEQHQEASESMAVDVSTELPAKHVPLFAPNRFNVGYDRTAPARAMEC